MACAEQGRRDQAIGAESKNEREVTKQSQPQSQRREWSAVDGKQCSQSKQREKGRRHLNRSSKKKGAGKHCNKCHLVHRGSLLQEGIHGGVVAVERRGIKGGHALIVGLQIGEGRKARRREGMNAVTQKRAARQLLMANSPRQSVAPGPQRRPSPGGWTRWRGGPLVPR